MHDILTEDTKAIILLCAVFGIDRSAKPLSLSEYTALVRWLVGAGMRPGDLLRSENVLPASNGANLDAQRLELLLGKGVQLGFAVEEWHRNGIWIISRSDAEYPARYRKHLKDKAPPLLFGVGERSLLHGGGLAIVGSRNVDQAGESFARDVATLCAESQIPVVSGGARGVDQAAMTGALAVGGVCIGILAEKLLQKSLERDARYALADGRLLLLSPYHPAAHFTVGTAMARNQLIYAMADYGLVVSAEHKKGGTWAGAEEELKRLDSRPVFVRSGKSIPAGNVALLGMGGIAWPELLEPGGVRQQLAALAAHPRKLREVLTPSLFDAQTPSQKAPLNVPVTAQDIAICEPKSTCSSAIYAAVLPVLLQALQRPATLVALAGTLDVHTAQLLVWLEKAVAENKVSVLVEEGQDRLYTRLVS